MMNEEEKQQEQQEQPQQRGCSVRFDTVEIRGYEVTLGDNPSVTRGPALSLDWGYEQELYIKVDDYEAARNQQSDGGKRRCKEEMLVPSIVREQILREWGVSRSEMKESQAMTQKIQQSRIKHATQSPRRQRSDELLEATKRYLESLSSNKKTTTDLMMLEKNETPKSSSSRTSSPRRSSMSLSILGRRRRREGPRGTTPLTVLHHHHHNRVAAEESYY